MACQARCMLQARRESTGTAQSVPAPSCSGERVAPKAHRAAGAKPADRPTAKFQTALVASSLAVLLQTTPLAATAAAQFEKDPVRPFTLYGFVQ